jgi:hypothetical protein
MKRAICISLFLLAGCAAPKVIPSPPDGLDGRYLAQSEEFLLCWRSPSPFDRTVVEVFADSKTILIDVPSGQTFCSVSAKELNGAQIPAQGGIEFVVRGMAMQGGKVEPFVSERRRVSFNRFPSPRCVNPTDLDPRGEFMSERFDLPLLFLIHDHIRFNEAEEEARFMFSGLSRQVIGRAFENAWEIEPDLWRSVSTEALPVLDGSPALEKIPVFKAEALMVVDLRPTLEVDGEKVPGQMCVRIHDIRRLKRGGMKQEYPLLYERYVNIDLPDSAEQVRFGEETLRCWSELLRDLTTCSWNNGRFREFLEIIRTDPGEEELSRVYGKLNPGERTRRSQLESVEREILFPDPGGEAPPEADGALDQ